MAHRLVALGAAARGTLDELGLELEGEGGFTGLCLSPLVWVLTTLSAPKRFHSRNAKEAS